MALWLGYRFNRRFSFEMWAAKSGRLAARSNIVCRTAIQPLMILFIYILSIDMHRFWFLALLTEVSMREVINEIENYTWYFSVVLAQTWVLLKQDLVCVHESGAHLSHPCPFSSNLRKEYAEPALQEYRGRDFATGQCSKAPRGCQCGCLVAGG